MTNDAFWEIIGRTKSASAGELEAQLEAIKIELSGLPESEVVEFDRIFGELKDRAYHWDLWGAAYIIGGGCSDDAFMDFRNWLISMGRDVYENALADVETLADLEIGDDSFFEELAYVASEVYEQKTGGDIPYLPHDFPVDPVGEPWEEKGDELERRFPRLWAKFVTSEPKRHITPRQNGEAIEKPGRSGPFSRTICAVFHWLNKPFE